MNGIFFWVPDISGGFPARVLAHSLPKQGQNGYTTAQDVAQISLLNSFIDNNDVNIIYFLRIQ